MAEINLAPGTEYVALAARRRRRVFGIAIAIALLAAAAWGGLWLLRQSYGRELRELGGQLSSVEAEITRLGEQAQRVQLFEERLSAVAGLIDSHITWDPFLQELERVLPPPAVVTRLKVDVASQTIELSGETPDVDAVAQTLASLASTPARPTLFTSAVLDSVTRVQQTAPDGQVIGEQYQFTAHATLNSQSLRYGHQ